MQSFRKVLFWIETVVAALFVAWGLFYIAEGVWAGSHDPHHGGMLVVAFGAYLLLEAIPFAMWAAALRYTRGWFLQLIPVPALCKVAVDFLPF